MADGVGGAPAAASRAFGIVSNATTPKGFRSPPLPILSKEASLSAMPIKSQLGGTYDPKNPIR